MKKGASITAMGRRGISPSLSPSVWSNIRRRGISTLLPSQYRYSICRRRTQQRYWPYPRRRCPDGGRRVAANITNGRHLLFNASGEIGDILSSPLSYPLQSTPTPSPISTLPSNTFDRTVTRLAREEEVNWTPCTKFSIQFMYFYWGWSRQLDILYLVLWCRPTPTRQLTMS